MSGLGAIRPTLKVGGVVGLVVVWGWEVRVFIAFTLN